MWFHMVLDKLFLWLYLRIDTFHPPLPLPDCTITVTACAPGWPGRPLLLQGGVGEGGGGRVMGTFSTSRVVRFTTYHCCDPGIMVTGPTIPAAARFPVVKGATAARRLESCVLSSLLLQGSLGLPAQPLWPRAKTASTCFTVP